MSKLFFDHLVVMERIELHINKNSASNEEKAELWNLVDDIVQTRVMDVILTKLPSKHHDEFLEKFSNFPHDERLLDYLKEKVEDIELEIQKEVKSLESEFMSTKSKKK